MPAIVVALPPGSSAMRLTLILPPVQPEAYPAEAALPGCRLRRRPRAAVAGGAPTTVRHAARRGGSRLFGDG